MADTAFLSTPEWNAYIRQAEFADRGYYVTPLYGSPEWQAAQASTQTQQTQTQPLPGDTTTDADMSAKAILNSALAQYGLESLADTVWGWWKEGRPVEQILLDIRGTPEYAQRFPAMSALAGTGHALSEQQYIEYERSASQLMQQYGIPAGFYDQPDDFASFLTNNISISELANRVQLAADVVYNAPPQARAELNTLYGVDEGHITAFMLDPERAQPFLQRAWNSARAAADWSQASLGQLTTGEAEQLAYLDPGAAAEKIAQLGAARELFSSLDFGEGAISRDTQLGSLTGNVEAQQAIATRAERRAAQFAGGTRYAQTSEGLTV